MLGRMALKESAQVVEREGNALEEVFFALVETAIAVGSEGLKNADEEVAPEVVKPLLPFGDRKMTCVKVVVEKLETNGVGEIALGAIEQRGDVVLRGSASASLIVDEIGSRLLAPH